MSSPKMMANRPVVEMMLSGSGGSSGELGNLVNRLRFRGSVNTGYMLYCRVFDAGFAVLRKLLGSADPADLGYLESGRKDVYKAKFALKWGSNGSPPDSAMEKQTAYIISLRLSGSTTDTSNFEFIAIDPPSWHLNCGDASGKIYKKMKLSGVIKQVIQDYAPGIEADVGETEDSDQNDWWMMRQDPKTFLVSLLDWSAPITKTKTQWMIGMDGTKISIKSQGEMQPSNIAMYNGPNLGQGGVSHIYNHELLADNALTVLNTKLVTHGLAAVSGQFLDKITDEKEQKKVYVKDKNTDKKYKAKINKEQGFTGPPDDKPPTVGWTSIRSIPEIYSAGDLGKQYQDYVDGCARSLFLNMSNLTMRAKFRVLGHGAWRDCMGLGVNTFTNTWKGTDGEQFFLGGKWIAYGWEHMFTPGVWYTDVFGARLDYDAQAKEA